MEGKKRQYSKELKKEAVQHNLTSERTVEEVARDLGISRSNLRRWRVQYRKDAALAFPGNGKERLAPQEEKSRRPQKEVYDIKEERDILKKSWPFSQKNREKLLVYPETH